MTILGDKLRLKDYHIDESYRFYKLALGHNFTRGRKAEQVMESTLGYILILTKYQ